MIAGSSIRRSSSKPSRRSFALWLCIFATLFTTLAAPALAAPVRNRRHRAKPLPDEAADGSVLDDRRTLVYVAIEVHNSQIKLNDRIVNPEGAASEGARLDVDALVIDKSPEGLVLERAVVTVSVEVHAGFDTVRALNEATGLPSLSRRLLVAVRVLEIANVRAVHVDLQQVSILFDDHGHERSRSMVGIGMHDDDNDQELSESPSEPQVPQEVVDQDDAPGCNSTCVSFPCRWTRAPLIVKVMFVMGTSCICLIALYFVVSRLCCNPANKARASRNNYGKNLLVAHPTVQYTMLLNTFDEELQK
ncbi:hypothetical protein CAOG_004366 [Capsaspora owczarzaki ATCC 30864]|uniref:Uncharacterized protein n=1 Tax=Capsaspora owczarzaki (strain ATCC 30864) TaxID=595528 RepID=A0A0D2X332_CAPO3|nr:hypothetical protein CAOG_004366 [Capsaspora owczarzaki ATCC 30864]